MWITRVERVVVERLADQSKQTDQQFGAGERIKVGARSNAIGHVSARQASSAETGHEGGHDHSDRVHVGARKNHQEPLPDHLIEKRGKSGEKEDDQRKHSGPMSALYSTWRDGASDQLLCEL